MANFSALLEEMDDQMLVGAAEDYEVSFTMTKPWIFFSKNVFSFYPLQKTEAENEKTQKDTRVVVEFVSMS